MTQSIKQDIAELLMERQSLLTGESASESAGRQPLRRQKPSGGGADHRIRHQPGIMFI
jgi:hypothetical protein